MDEGFFPRSIFQGWSDGVRCLDLGRFFFRHVSSLLKLLFVVLWMSSCRMSRCGSVGGRIEIWCNIVSRSPGGVLGNFLLS